MATSGSDAHGALVEAYMAAFARKDLAALEGLLAEDATLEDSVVGRVTGRAEVLRIDRELFEAHDLELELRRRFVAPDGGIAQEFRLTLRGPSAPVVVEGIDLFEFRGARIAGIRAYLHTR